MTKFQKGQIAWNKGKTFSYKPRYKMRGNIPWNKGKTSSEETKRRLSESHKGQHSSLKTEFKKGNIPWSKGTIGVVVSGMKGKHQSEESKRKMSLARKGKPTPWMMKRIVSEETKRKLKLANLGKHVSEETRKKISLSERKVYAEGRRIAFWKGKHPSKETLRKRSESMKGKNKYKRTEETRRKIGLASRGRPSAMKGKKHTSESILKMSESHKKTLSNPEIRKMMSESLKRVWLNPELRKRASESQKKSYAKGKRIHPMKGKYHSEESKRKMSESLKKIWINPELRKRQSEKYRGEKSLLWKGGISFEPYSLEWTKILKKLIKQRDNYTCQLCYKKGTIVHHIDYNKKNCNPENLITLCTSCHSKTNINRERWLELFRGKLIPNEII